MNKLNIVLFVVMISFALWVVNARSEARSIYSQLDKMHNQENQLNAEYEQLRIEQSTWGAHNLVDKAATKRLGMHLPGTNETILISTTKSTHE